MRPGETDHRIVNSKGATIGLLLKSKYPTEWSLQQARKAYAAGQKDGKAYIKERGRG